MPASGTRHGAPAAPVPVTAGGADCAGFSAQPSRPSTAAPFADEAKSLPSFAQTNGHGLPNDVMLSGPSVEAFQAACSGTGKFGTAAGEGSRPSTPVSAVPMRVLREVSATPMTPTSTGAKLAADCNTSASSEPRSFQLRSPLNGSFVPPIVNAGLPASSDQCQLSCRLQLAES